MSRQAFWRTAIILCCAARASYGQSPAENSRLLFERVRAAAQAGRIEAAEEDLRALVRAGFTDFSALQRDATLAPLRNRPVMAAILAARDAADPILASRRVEEWREKLGRTGYDYLRDDRAHVDLIVATSSETTPRETLLRLEESVARLVPSIFPETWRQRVLVVVLDDADARIFLPHANTHGKYVHADRLILVADGERTLRHEVVHALHNAHMDSLGQQHPAWVQEGLASLFESGISAPREFERNERDTIARMMVESGRDRPLSDFFVLNENEFSSDAGSHYAMARSLLRFLHDRGALEAWYTRLCAQWHGDRAGIHAFATALGLSIDEAEQSWREFVLAEEHVATPLAVPHNDETQITAAAAAEKDESLDARERAHNLYDRIRPRLLHEYTRAVPHLREVLALDPELADARYDLGLAFVLEGDLEAAMAERDLLLPQDPNLASLLDSIMATGRDL